MSRFDAAGPLANLNCRAAQSKFGAEDLFPAPDEPSAWLSSPEEISGNLHVVSCIVGGRLGIAGYEPKRRNQLSV